MKLAFGIIPAVLMTLTTACSSSAPSTSESEPAELIQSSVSSEAIEKFQTITAEEAKEKIDAGNVTIVDVRTEEEYLEKHIPDAILVPLDTIGDSQPDKLPELDAVLLVHCRTGVRSRQASEKLADLGYSNVFNFGGIESWPYDTVSGEESK